MVSDAIQVQIELWKIGPGTWGPEMFAGKWTRLCLSESFDVLEPPFSSSLNLLVQAALHEIDWRRLSFCVFQSFLFLLLIQVSSVDYESTCYIRF